MGSLLQVGLNNAMAAAVLAVAVAPLAYALRRRPALVHPLWVLVLLKLVTPPLWTVEVPSLWPAARETVNAARAMPTAMTMSVTLKPMASVERELVLVSEPPPDLDEVDTGRGQETASPPSPVPTPISIVGTRAESLAAVPPIPPSFSANSRMPADRARAPSPSQVGLGVREWIGPALGLAWLSGSALWLSVAAIRIRRFLRLLRHASPAPASLQARAVEMSARLGLSSCPGVWMVPGPVCPMLWALGGEPRLIVPEALWERLGEKGRDSLLVHELAHLRRGDHRVRWLELFATTLYWWHPAAWWARRELREAEEQCCDAWVVWALPETGRAYASALLDAVDFLSGARPALPTAASGMGQVHHLKRRLLMIKKAETSKGLTWAGSLAIWGFAAAILPLTPTWAQQPAPAPAPAPSAVEQDETRVETIRIEKEEQEEKDQLAIEEKAEQDERTKEAKAEQDALLKEARDSIQEVAGEIQESVKEILTEVKLDLPDHAAIEKKIMTTIDQVNKQTMDQVKKAGLADQLDQIVNSLRGASEELREGLKSGNLETDKIASLLQTYTTNIGKATTDALNERIEVFAVDDAEGALEDARSQIKELEKQLKAAQKRMADLERQLGRNRPGSQRNAPAIPPAAPTAPPAPAALPAPGAAQIDVDIQLAPPPPVPARGSTPPILPPAPSQPLPPPSQGESIPSLPPTPAPPGTPLPPPAAPIAEAPPLPPPAATPPIGLTPAPRVGGPRNAIPGRGSVRTTPARPRVEVEMRRDQPLDDHERRLRSLENKLDKILNHLEKMSPAPASPSGAN